MFHAVVAAIVLAGCAADRTPARATASPIVTTTVAAPPTVATAAPKTPVRLRDVILHPAWVGHAVTVDVFERLFVDTRTPLVVSAFVADVAATHFLFVEGPDDNANLGFTMMLTHPHPLRVHGIVATSEGGGFQIAVDHTELAPLPPAHELANVHELIREPAKWADVLVEVDATLDHNSEVLDREVWLEPILSLPEVHCAPPEGSKDNAIATFRLHIIGFAHTRGHYGHGSAWAAEIVPTDVTFVDPKGDDCK